MPPLNMCAISLVLIKHYENMPMQYTAIFHGCNFHGCKNDNFQLNFFFSIFTFLLKTYIVGTR